MINYFAKKDGVQANTISLKKRAIILVVALLATSVVYGLFLYSTHDILISPKPSLGLSLDDKQVVWDYMTLNIDDLSPEKPSKTTGHFKIDRIRYQDKNTALVRYNDGETYYEGQAAFTLVTDPQTQKLVPDVTNFVNLQSDGQPLVN